MSLKIHTFFFPLCVLIIICLLQISCHKEVITHHPDKLLRLENDTLSFDTVFTTIGSATRYLKIYNPHDQNIIIQKAYITNTNSNDFRMNIDGNSGNYQEEIEIRANDSIYLFCEVTINPDDPLTISPFVKMDSVILEYNGIKQSILLLAYGQNANYFPSKLNKGQVTSIDLQGSTLIWNDQKPYIIYGIIYIDNGTLIIEENTKIHVWGGLTKAADQKGNVFFYNDGRIIIGTNASLKVKGTQERPVIFQGVRLESSFQNIPGQWSGIFLEKMSRGNEFKYAIIKNNLIGIFADSLSECRIAETQMYNNSLYGIYANTAIVNISNSLFYNQGSSGILLNTGGTYEINYCTLVNNGNSDPAIFLSNARCIDFPFCELIYESDLNAIIRNSIITGSDEDEVWMSQKNTSMFDIKFQNCLFRVKKLMDNFPDFLTIQSMDCINHPRFDKLFKDIYNNDFHPDTLSLLEQKAIPLPNILMDLEGNVRDVLKPDIGCYEYTIK